MSFLDRIERRLDRSVTSVFSHGGQIKPLDLAQGLRRECDDQIQVLDRDRTLAPNHFTIYLNPADYDGFATWQDSLAEELQRMLVRHAQKQDYTFVGAVSVHLEEDDAVRKGRFETESRTEQSAVAPATDSGHAVHPILEIDGQQYLLTGDITVIGRGSDSDIILDDTGVSRHHVELRWAGSILTVTDLGSTNGTRVDGRDIKTPVEAHDGSTVRVGRTTMTVTLPAGPSPEDW